MTLAEQLMLQFLQNQGKSAGGDTTGTIRPTLGISPTNNLGSNAQLVLKLQDLGLLDAEGSQLNLTQAPSYIGGTRGAEAIAKQFASQVGNRLAEAPKYTETPAAAPAAQPVLPMMGGANPISPISVAARRGDTKVYKIPEAAPAPAAPAPRTGPGDNFNGRPLPNGYRWSPFPGQVYDPNGQLVYVNPFNGRPDGFKG
jgi:hypothetical protein